MTKVVREYIQNKLNEQIADQMRELDDQVRSFDEHLTAERKIALEKAREAYQGHMRAVFPEMWAAMEKADSSQMPSVSQHNTYRYHNPFSKARDEKRRQLDKKACNFITELVVDYEIGGMKKDELLAYIGKFAEYGS